MAHLNNSMCSSEIISFNPNSLKMISVEEREEHPKEVMKSVEKMTPEELVDANPALKQLMTTLLKGTMEKDQNSCKQQASQETKGVSNGNRKVVHSRGIDKNIQERNVIKSPSDTMIYAPALKLTPTKVIQDSVAMKLMKTPQNSNGNDARNPLMREEDGSVAGTCASGVNKGQINQGNDLMKEFLIL